MATHAMLVNGTGGTAAGTKKQIGSNITLPAGGPWTVFGLYGLAVKDTTAADEGTGGDLIIESVSGDLTPDPAPGIYPLIGSPIAEGAAPTIAAVPLNIWDVNWQAAGKSVVALYYRNRLAITTGSDVIAGILFGTEVPPIMPQVFCDSVHGSFASASEQLLGTITLAEKATALTGILVDLNKGDAATAGEPINGWIRLQSDDVRMPPSYYPVNRGFDASLGTAAGASATPRSSFIPISIPVTGGSRIDVYAQTTASVTGNADFSVYLAYN